MNGIQDLMKAKDKPMPEGVVKPKKNPTKSRREIELAIIKQCVPPPCHHRHTLRE